jgi:hypothetical protein
MKNLEYWTCYIGPIDRDELDKTHPMGEGCIRSYVQEAFYKVAGHYADKCGSGWGCKPEYLDHMSFGNNTEETKIALVKSYIYENKKLLNDWLVANNILHPKTFISFDYNDASEYIKNQNNYPIVAKINIGASGKAFGAHLHFETLVNGKYRNPGIWLWGND